MSRFEGAGIIDVQGSSLKDQNWAQTYDPSEHKSEAAARVDGLSWNSSEGAAVTSSGANRMQKGKHQINSLAAAAQARELEVARIGGARMLTKAQTQAKYGW